ncbi:MAG: 23S rRNA (uracil(1939)-C(5))-methyltransferase RlmD [Gemmatimonadota bacterium]|nr:MAG: 23S rRNA (uracil(1939)-C(5))-methyltransferase RlmD [Gemmatimonadota bacterium]
MAKGRVAVEARIASSDTANTSPVEVRIRALSSDGSGVGDLPDGPVVFVHRTAPNDRVRVVVQKKKARWARARLREILESSSDRASPPCPYYHECGGCTLQHIPYESQLLWKGRFVADALTRIGGLEETVPEVQPSPKQLGYRSRVTFTLLRVGGDRVVAGFHKLDAPTRVLDVPGACLIADPRINRAWAALRRSWGPGARKLPGGRTLRLTLMASDAGVVLVVAGGRGKGDLGALVDADSGIVSVWRGGESGPPRLVAGAEVVHDTLRGEPVRVGPGTFSQVNAAVGEALVERLLASLPVRPGLRMIDAYCGTGLIAREMARGGASVVGIEIDPAAVAVAREEAPMGLEVLQGPVEQLLSSTLPADVVILNPPRGGLARSVPDALSESPVPLLAYISCDPATLARDLERLAGAYEVKQVFAFDMFPQTAHVETLVTLASRKNSD